MHTTYSKIKKSYVYDKTFFDPLKKLNMYNYDVYLIKDLKENWKMIISIKELMRFLKKKIFLIKLHLEKKGFLLILKNLIIIKYLQLTKIRL